MRIPICVVGLTFACQALHRQARDTLLVALHHPQRATNGVRLHLALGVTKVAAGAGVSRPDQDRRMDPLQAAFAWRKALRETGDPRSRVEFFPNANHDLVVSEIGCPDDDLRWLEEYAKARGHESLAAAMAAIQENPSLMSQFPFAPGHLDLIEEWLRGLPQ